MKKFVWTKRKIFFIILFSVLLLQLPVLATSTSTEPSSPTPTQAPTPKPTPTENPAYEQLIVKEGDDTDDVILVQDRLRDLGYYTYKISGYYGSLTSDSVKDFQTAHKLAADGVVGGETANMLFSNAAMRSTGNNKRVVTPTPKPTPKPTQKVRYGEIVEWSKAKNFVAWGGGKKFKCIDFWTGKTYYLIRVGGSNHMDVEPATKADTATLKAAYGGKWSWDRRPTLVQFNGKWYAASINGWPHGKETVKNNDMTGQICLHFTNSRTHGTNLKDSDHQRCIQIAAGKR